MTRQEKAIGFHDSLPCSLCPARYCGESREAVGSKDAQQPTTSKNGVRYVFGVGERE